MVKMTRTRDQGTLNKDGAVRRQLPGLTVGLIIGVAIGGLFANISNWSSEIPMTLSQQQSPSESLTVWASLTNPITKEEQLQVLSTLLKVNGDFCSATKCQIGTTRIREAFTQAPHAMANMQKIKENKFVPITVDGTEHQMFIRDPKRDQYISSTIAKGAEWDPSIRRILVAALKQKKNAVVIDVGANIGYFTTTALALGARTISFEPFMDNAAAIMSTVEKNGWQDRATIYMNAATYEASHVNMMSTHEQINLSNMKIKESTCAGSELAGTSGTYGVDYMEGVLLDQVWLTNHADIKHVDLIKIDVEIYEIQVLNGAMHLLCNAVVEQIVMEVEYLKPKNADIYGGIPCSFSAMQNQLEKMGYAIWDNERKQSLTGKDLSVMSGDVLFALEDTSMSPAQRLRGTTGNPCHRFDLEASWVY